MSGADHLSDDEKERLHILAQTGVLIIEVPPEVRKFLEGIRPPELESLELLVSLGPEKIRMLMARIDTWIFRIKLWGIGRWALLGFLAIISGTAIFLENAEKIYGAIMGMFGK